MRYYHEKPDIYLPLYGERFECDHPVFSQGTIFRKSRLGLVVIQQRYDPITKHTWWGEIDPWLCNDIFFNLKFDSYFHSMAKEEKDGLYPVVTIRQLMWALRMKPIKRERWETCFDHKDI